MSESRKYRDGKEPVHLWIDKDVKDAWTAFAEESGKSVKDVIVEAVARHMAYPPPPPAPVEPAPLPDVAPKRGRGRPVGTKKKVQNNS